MELCSLFFLNSKGCLLSLEAELRFVFGVPSRALLYLRGWYRKEGLGLGGNAWVGGSWVCLERSTQEGRAPTPPPPTLAVGGGSGGGHTFLAACPPPAPPPSRWALAAVVATPFWQGLLGSAFSF